ncbi:MAG: D-alanine--D-alanine ligase [Flavobacteriales bacterium]|nr:D-alanine--D-alanine ligase [Flavobacteriales bacterium]MCB9166104.1 D-alanine--D-alanine ligase [Flavobacteriales bacterium]
MPTPMPQLRPPIAVVRGGYSGEAVISHQSAERMMIAIDRELYDPFYVTITRDAWSCGSPEGAILAFDRGGFRIDRGAGMEPFAFALIAIHGTPGEDGKLQGYLDMLGVPYQTGGVVNMAITFSKYATTALLRQAGFTTADSMLLTDGGTDPATIAERIGFPCFVKPDQSGSSLGISKVRSADALPKALALAFAESNAVMVEAAVTGRELTCGVVRTAGTTRALPLCEVRTPREFFDYHAKYHDKATEEIVPAPVPDMVTHLCQARSAAIYDALGCRGMVRVDHIWTGEVLSTIEVNTTPGFSAASIFPKMLQAEGLAVEDLINDLVQDGLQTAGTR